MTFREAVKATADVSDACRKGLKALAQADRRRISVRNARCLTGSVNLDERLQWQYPNGDRWDYGIGVRRDDKTEAAVWIEVHDASSEGAAKKVMRKLQFLKWWLRERAPQLKRITPEADCPYFWIATGRVSGYLPHGKHARSVAAAGLKGPMRRLQL